MNCGLSHLSELCEFISRDASWRRTNNFETDVLFYDKQYNVNWFQIASGWTVNSEHTSISLLKSLNRKRARRDQEENRKRTIYLSMTFSFLLPVLLILPLALASLQVTYYKFPTWTLSLPILKVFKDTSLHHVGGSPDRGLEAGHPQADCQRVPAGPAGQPLQDRLEGGVLLHGGLGLSGKGSQILLLFWEILFSKFRCWALDIVWLLWTRQLEICWGFPSW